MAILVDEDMLGDDLEAWMSQSSLLKRTFRSVAVIAGLIERSAHAGRDRGMTNDQMRRNSKLCTA
jgi:ATP-dependent Lhr-like helicase